MFLPLGRGLHPTRLSVEETFCASQHKLVADVRFGSKADIGAPSADVRFTPNSGHWNSVVECPLCARSGHWAPQQKSTYSITSSAAFSRRSGTSRPSAFAVFRLMINGKLTGIWIGRSPGSS